MRKKPGTVVNGGACLPHIVVNSTSPNQKGLTVRAVPNIAPPMPPRILIKSQDKKTRKTAKL